MTKSEEQNNKTKNVSSETKKILTKKCKISICTRDDFLDKMTRV
jgi:hypothetical protein